MLQNGANPQTFCINAVYKCRPPPQCDGLEREGALLHRICHPNVVRVLGLVPLKQGNLGAPPLNALVRDTTQ